MLQGVLYTVSPSLSVQQPQFVYNQVLVGFWVEKQSGSPHFPNSANLTTPFYICVHFLRSYCSQQDTSGKGFLEMGRLLSARALVQLAKCHMVFMKNPTSQAKRYFLILSLKNNRESGMSGLIHDLSKIFLIKH